MAIKKKINFNIDKLKLCYKQPKELFEKLAEYKTNSYIDYDDFKLHIIDDGRSEDSDKEPNQILANVILQDGTLLGEFVFNNSAKYEGKCFFTFDNKALYKVYSFDSEKHNYQACLDYVATILGLELNNITLVEIAADINFNPTPKIQKLIRDHQNYSMIHNGKAVKQPNRNLIGFGEYYERSREKREKYPTLYFNQSKKESIKLRIYDKSKEIEEQSPCKHYIEEWNGFGKQKVYRMEISIRNEDFKHSLQTDEILAEWCNPVAFNELLGLEAFKCHLWDFNANRLVYFRSKGTNETISLLDIAKGKEIER